MIDALIRWSLRNRGLVLALAAGFLAWGGYVVARMPVDVLPDLTAPTVTVLVEGRGMAPTEMESLVTFPIEAALNGAAGVRRVRSATAVGIAVIWVEFEWGEDIYRARQTVSEKLSVVADTLPPEVERPVLAPVSSIMGEILFIALNSEKHSPLELRTVADTIIRRRVLAVPGVSQVTPIGGGQKQYQVLVSPALLKAYGVTLSEVEEALRRSNRNTSAGFLVAGGQEYLIQGIGRATELESIAHTVVATRGTQPVLVGHLGQVQIGAALKRGEGSHNGKPAVVLGIQKQPGANTLELTRALDAVLDDIQQSLPEGMTIEKHIFRQADFIEAAYHNLLGALRDGGLLVVVVVFVFLGNLRASSITILAIPLSLLAAVIVMKLAGATINSMTLGGLAIAVGAVVDDAIINVENVFRRLRGNAQKPPEEQKPVLEVVYRASSEIQGSIVFATIIIILVFLPLFFLSGVEGLLLRPLGLAYVAALFASLVVALTVTPVLCSFFLPRARAVVEGHEPRLVQWLKHRYERDLPRALDNSRLVLGGSAVLLLATIISFFWAGRTFLPEFNEGTLTISAVTLPGTSLEESNKVGTTVEQILLGIPEVSATNEIEVTALHNHFFWEEPRIFYMHIHGRGAPLELAKRIRPALDLVGQSSAKGNPAGQQGAPGKLNAKRLSEIIGHDGAQTGPVYKITIGREGFVMKEHGAVIDARMGLNTWAAFAGTDDDAVVAGDVAMLEHEVTPVLKALRENGIEVVAIHHHMTEVRPVVIFLHYWGRGPAATLATAFRNALDELGRGSAHTTPHL